MEYINRIELQGKVGNVRTCEQYTDTVQNFSLLTKHMIKLRDGAAICEATLHQIVAWNMKSVEKGDTVRVIGRLRQLKYTAADGTERVFNEIIASELEIIER